MSLLSSARLEPWKPATLGLMLMCSCWRLSSPTAQPSLPVTVEQFAATFEAEDRGQFTLDLLAKNPEPDTGHARAMEWELWLNGRRFAEGLLAIDQPIKAGENRFTVAVPLTLPRRQLVRGPIVLRVGIRGRLVVTYGTTNVWLAFARQLQTSVASAPIWKAEED